MGGRRRRAAERLGRARFSFCYSFRAGGCDGEVPAGQRRQGVSLRPASWGRRGLAGGLPRREDSDCGARSAVHARAPIPAPPAPSQRRGTGWEGMEEAPGPEAGKARSPAGRRLGARTATARAQGAPSQASRGGRVRPLPTLRGRPLPRRSSHLHMIRHFAPFMLLSGPLPPSAHLGRAAAAAAAVAAAPARWGPSLRWRRSAAGLRRPRWPAGGWRMRSAAGTP